MGKGTKISWTRSDSGVPGYTFNAWWGCFKVSEECLHCYAETLAIRWGYDIFGPKAERRLFDAKHFTAPLGWDAEAAKAGERRRVFCGSMMDLFEDRPELDIPRARTFDVIAKTPHLDWLLCTKRPENIAAMLPDNWMKRPWPNVWLLATAGTGPRLLERWGHLVKIPAVVRGISAEPLLGPLTPTLKQLVRDRVKMPDWMIVGGESGGNARPIGNGAGDPNDEEAIDGEELGGIRGACQAMGIAYFFKQTGAVFARHAEFKDRRAGADPAEWPECMRVQQFPKPRVIGF